MVCQLCAGQAYTKCAQCRIDLCEECAVLYIVGSGCSTTPVFLCPKCKEEYSTD